MLPKALCAQKLVIKHLFITKLIEHVLKIVLQVRSSLAIKYLAKHVQPNV
jgi:hypothetical protein